MRDYKPGIHLTGDARETARQDAARRYDAGATIHTIADHLGRSYGNTRVLLLEAGVTMRKRGGSRKKAS